MSFKKISRTILAIFLTSNLVLLATGSAELNLASPSADLTGESTPSAETSQTETTIVAPERSFKSDTTGTFIEDELVVKFKDYVDLAQEQEILTANGVATLKENKSKAILLKVDPLKREEIMDALSANPNVEYVHKNQIGKLQESTGGGGGGLSSGVCIPNDYYFACYGDLYQWGIKKANLPYAWNWNKGSSSTRIAVVDSGVDYNHYDLGLFGSPPSGSSAGKVIKGWDWVSNDSNPMDEDIYGIGHGTLVAGVLGALTNNTSGIAGANWYTKIIAIRVANNQMGSNGYDVADGIYDAVDRGAQVINISIAFPDTDPTLRNAINFALDSNKIIVASVQNSTTTNCFMGFPAAYFGVVSVVATKQDDTWYSGCTGSVKSGITYQGIQVSAPGKDIFTLKMNGGIGYVSGTSLATPIVSGVAAMLVGCGVDPVTAKYDLILGSDDRGSIGWDSTYGFGRINAYKALARHCI